MTNQQQESPNQKNDDFEEYLKELNEQLDEIEESQYQEEYQKELKRRRNQKQNRQQQKANNLTKIVLCCIAGASIGAIISGFVFISSDSNYEYEIEETYADDQAIALYDTSYKDGYIIDNQEYSYESTLQDFIDDGWSIQEYKSEDINPILEEGNYVSVRLTKENKEIADVGIENFTSDPVALEKATITNIYVYDDDFEFGMPLGLKKGLSIDEVRQIMVDHNIPYKETNSDYMRFSVDMYGYDEATNISKSVNIDVSFDDNNKVDNIYYYIYSDGYSQVLSVG